jgi:hypothetical protein
MPDVRWSITEHRGPEGVAALEADWRRLYSEMPAPGMWHSHEAFSTYVDHLCPEPERLVCFALSEGDRVRAILPIEERTERGLAELGLGIRPRVWGMPWQEGWSITDAIGPEDDARQALLPLVVERLRSRPGRPPILVLGRTRATSVLWDGLDSLSPLSVFSFADGGECVVPTDVPFEAFVARLSRNSRQILRRAARKFEALEGAAYVRAVAREDLLAEYERFLEVEASGWKGKHGSSVRQQPGLEGFYRALLERLTLDGHCEIHSLHAEDRCIASEYCTYMRGQAAMYKTGYDESYGYLAPGRLNNFKTLEWCCEDPDIGVMSEVSDAPWFRHWMPTVNGMRRAYVSLRPVSGALLILALRFRFGLVRRVVRTVTTWRHGRDAATQVQSGRQVA